jgi:hypothetical protein
MQVVNRAIEVTSDTDTDDPLQQTLFQKFVAFIENLSWVAQEDSYSVIDDLGNGLAAKGEAEKKGNE